jgi:S1-C subfamily serine protease
MGKSAFFLLTLIDFTVRNSAGVIRLLSTWAMRKPVSLLLLTLAVTVGLGGETIEASAQSSPYSVDGLPLGSRVRFESEAYKSYNCGPSEKFADFTWCHREQTERTNRGEVLVANSILHAGDGTAVYVNRYVEPAFFKKRNVRAEIDRLSAKFGQGAREFWLPEREGLPRAVIAIWGKIELEQLEPSAVATVAAGGRERGLLVSFLGDLQRSAKAQVPIYRLSGGAGFLWAATFNQRGRGVLRFLTVDASRVEPAVAQYPSALSRSPPLPPAEPRVGDAAYAKIGWWSVTHRVVGNLNGCSASAQFADQTAIDLALIQSETGKGWALFVSNPRWDGWVAKSSQHLLWVISSKVWHATLNASDDRKTLILNDASLDFVNSIADSQQLQIFTDSKQPLASLDMRDSESAIKSVVNCVREHPFTPQPVPEAGETSFYGTAFFVGRHVLLTNNHVVKECRGPIKVRYPDKPWSSARISGADDTNDLALLDTEMESLSVAGFHLQPRLGESVAAYGFPYASVLSSSGNFTLGNVTSLTGMKDDTRFVQMSTPIQPGNSGGPLLDMSGSVVGVVVAQLNALLVMQADQSVPQNVNFAIQAPIVINFLAVKGVSPKLESSNTGRTMSPSDVADLAKQVTVQVYCEGNSTKTSRTGQQQDATFGVRR